MPARGDRPNAEDRQIQALSKNQFFLKNILKVKSKKSNY
jgi:hypothetical protein